MEVLKVTKRYGVLEALHEISFSVEPGEFVVFLGPSGSGKTTLLRCIAGLEQTDGGSVAIQGKVVDGLPARERDVAMVFQTYALFPNMNSKDNIAFPLRVRGTPPDEIERRVKEVADKLGIADLLVKSPRQLSGGEQQRVAIGRAIVRQTKLLLMDEPLSSLDAPLRAQLRTELKTLQRELGLTVIYVTHDQVEAMTLADKMGLIDRGRLVQYGTPRELYDNPSTPFVAKFVGTPGANLLDVRVAVTNRSVSLQGKDLSIQVPESRAEELAAKDGIVLVMAVRPEDIKLLKVGDASSFKAKIELVELLGPNSIVDMRAGLARLKALVIGDFDGSPGEDIWCRVNFEGVRFFAGDHEVERVK